MAVIVAAVCSLTRVCVFHRSDAEYRMPTAGTRATYSPDGQYVAAGSITGDIYIWNTATQKRETVLTGGHKCGWLPRGCFFLG